MLRSALDRASSERKLSTREVAKQLGFKQATFISQMAQGRSRVPLERAIELARAVDLPPASFLAAAVAQQVPEALDLLGFDSPPRVE